jgi:hypothetical protein
VIKRLSIIGALLFMALLAVQPALAQGIRERVILNERYVLRSNQIHTGSLTIVARDVELQPGSRVDGDLSIVSAGKVVLSGEINGDVSILAPGAQLDGSLRVNGDLSVCARDFKRDVGATITGNQSTGCNQLGAVFGGVGRGAGNFPQFVEDSVFGDSNPVVRFFRVVVTSFGLAALAALAATVFPNHIKRMTETAMSRIATTTVVGFVSMGVALALSAVYLLAIVLTLGLACLALPLVGVAWLVIILALITGWIAVSVPLGTLVLHRLKVYPTPMVAAAVGTLVLTLTLGVVEMIPCIGWLSWLMLAVLGSAGLGSVLLTRFGTRPYPEIIPVRAYPEIV